MKKIPVLSFLIVLFSVNMFSQDFDIDQISEDVDIKITLDSIKEVRQEKKTIKKLERNWYQGSMVPLISTDKNLTIGLRLNTGGLYIDFKSNFGLWGKDKPSDYDIAFDDLDWILYDMDGTFQDSTIDESSSVYILNVGYNIPLVKTKSITLSLFAGPGLAIISEKTYDRYRPEFLNENYYHTSKEVKTEVNVNAGIELALRNGGGILLGMDSKTSSLNIGYVLPY